MPMRAQKEGSDMAPIHLQSGTRKRWAVSTTFWPLYPLDPVPTSSSPKVSCYTNYAIPATGRWVPTFWRYVPSTFRDKNHWHQGTKLCNIITQMIINMWQPQTLYKNWQEVPTWCNNYDILSKITSTCFGHLHAHLLEYRLYATAYGVQH